MTYCLGIVTRQGLVMASDSRTNAGYDQVNICRKMHTFVQPGEKVFVVLSSGGLSLTQSVITLLRRDFDQRLGPGRRHELVRRCSGDRRAGPARRRAGSSTLERDEYRFNVHLLLGGQIRGESPHLYLIYPQGNPLMATEDSPYLQIGECKYGRPILDRGIRHDVTTLEEAAKYALISLDSTMRSNVTVGPPIDLVVYSGGEMCITRHRRFPADDPDLLAIHTQWETALRKAVLALPEVRFPSSNAVAGNSSGLDSWAGAGL